MEGFTACWPERLSLQNLLTDKYYLTNHLFFLCDLDAALLALCISRALSQLLIPLLYFGFD